LAGLSSAPSGYGCRHIRCRFDINRVAGAGDEPGIPEQCRASQYWQLSNCFARRSDRLGFAAAEARRCGTRRSYFDRLGNSNPNAKDLGVRYVELYVALKSGWFKICEAAR
jgi:hypothetical protein